MPSLKPHPEHLRVARLRDAFAREFGVREIRFSSFNLARMLNLTGERPQRVIEMRGILCALGLGDHRWIAPGGVFDHGEFWGRDRRPWAIVGHPYHINDERRDLLAELARYPGLRVAVDDRPSYYGWGTNHVRVSLAEVHRPWKSVRSTPKTRSLARQARAAFEAEGLPPVAVTERPARRWRGF